MAEPVHAVLQPVVHAFQMLDRRGPGMRRRPGFALQDRREGKSRRQEEDYGTFHEST